jgi:hypothetical protein
MLPLVTLHIARLDIPDQIRTDQIRDYRVRLDLIGDKITLDQVRSDQSKSDHIRSDQILDQSSKLDYIRSKLHRLHQIISNIRLDQIMIRSDHISY